MKTKNDPLIASEAIVGDCHSATLVSLNGSVDWCSFCRFEARQAVGSARWLAIDRSLVGGELAGTAGGLLGWRLRRRRQC